jgi:hypothetical protein
MVLRARFRIVVLTAAFLAGAAVFVAAALMPDTPPGYRVAFGAVALVFAVLAVRCARMRVVATSEGLTMYGPLHNQTVRWADMMRIVGSDTETDGRTLPVRAPVILMPGGRKIKIRPLSSYAVFPPADGTYADRMAARLEEYRTGHTTR